MAKQNQSIHHWDDLEYRAGKNTPAMDMSNIAHSKKKFFAEPIRFADKSITMQKSINRSKNVSILSKRYWTERDDD